MNVIIKCLIPNEYPVYAHILELCSLVLRVISCLEHLLISFMHAQWLSVIKSSIEVKSCYVLI